MSYAAATIPSPDWSEFIRRLGMGPIYRCGKCIEFYTGKVEEL